MRSQIMFRNQVILVLLLSLCLMISEGYALHELFRSIDTNEDGKIEKGEFIEDMQQHAFDKLDSDKDNALTADEWSSSSLITENEKHAKLFERIDTSKDRRITFLEFSSYVEGKSNIEEVFIGLDTDKNNLLTPDEITVRPHIRILSIRF